MFLNRLLYLSCWLAESTSEEPGDEGADGSDEEPRVGRQRYADTEEMTVWFYLFLLEGGRVSFVNKSHTEDDKVQVKRGMLDFQLEVTHNSPAGTSWLGHYQLKSSCHFFWVTWGPVLWLPSMRTTVMSSWTPALCMRQWFLSAIQSFITSVLRFILCIIRFQ